jgi:hypothetical protein
MKEQLMTIINSHNAVVTALGNCTAKVDQTNLFSAMTVWHKLACEGADIVHLARQHGIDAKINMQSGEILIHS